VTAARRDGTGRLGWAASVLVVVLIAATVDVVLTRRATSWRPQTAALAWQTLLAWALAALAALLAALPLGRAWASRVGRLTVLLAGPVALHAVLREPLRRPGGLGEPAVFGALALVAGGVAAAALLLALGERRLRGTARRAALGLIVLGAAAGLWPRGDAGDRTPAPGPPGTDRPNLLLLVWDTTRADALVPYGAERETTPHLARLAERATVFEHAFSPSVFTLTSHTSMLTGLWPSLHGTFMHQQRVTVDTVATTLRRAGYRTGAFVGTSVLRGGGGLERGFDVYDDRVDPPVCDTHLWGLVHDVQAALAAASPRLFGGDGLPHWFQDFQRPAGEVLDAVLAFIERDDPRPWFVMVNLFDVHWPYLPGETSREVFVRPYDGPLDGYLFRADALPDGYEPDAQDERHARDLYDAEMWELDRAVDAFLGELDLEQGRTAVVMTSDHGEALGEAGTWGHGDLIAPQTRVPFVVFAPGRAEAGARRDDPVSGVDVAPTLLGLAGLPPRAPDGGPLVGIDVLARRRGDGSAPADTIFIEDRDNYERDNDQDAIVQGRFVLVQHVDGRRTLHDWRADPLHEVDLSDEHPALAEALDERLDELLAAREPSSGELGNLEALRALGYLGGEGPPARERDADDAPSGDG